MKIDFDKTLILKGDKTASAPKVGEPVTKPFEMGDVKDVDISQYKVEGVSK